MNKGIIIGIIIVVAIAIGFGVLMSSDNTIQSPETDEIAETEVTETEVTETEVTETEVTETEDHSVTLEESVSVKTP